jgi:hypothetical protein
MTHIVLRIVLLAALAAGAHATLPGNWVGQALAMPSVGR